MKTTAIPPSFAELRARILLEGKQSAKRILESCGGESRVEKYDTFMREKIVDGKGVTRQILTTDKDYIHLTYIGPGGCEESRIGVQQTDNGSAKVLHAFSSPKVASA